MTLDLPRGEVRISNERVELNARMVGDTVEYGGLRIGRVYATSGDDARA